MKKYLDEVTRAFLSYGKPFSKKDEVYQAEKMYQTNYKIYNVSREKLRLLEKKHYSFSDLPLSKQAKIWSYIFKNTPYMGVGHLAINYFKSFQKKKGIDLVQFWPLLKTWISKIENWAHGDMTASLYSQMLEEDFSKIYPELQKWASHKNPWKRRMAIISLFYYARCRKTYPPFKKAVALLIPQLEVDHYYVQKAVGWTLRELSQAYPKDTSRLMDKELYRISSIAFSASIEKLSKSRKDSLKMKRKNYRSKNV